MQQAEEALWYRIFAALLCILFFLSYLIPEWATALINQLNFYSNAWDEANYLTHQMALTLRYSPSYWFGENIYLFLESFGMSGSWQNILFDTLLPPTIVILTVCILRKILNVSMANAILYALLIWFSSVLFSYTNPFIGYIYAHQFPGPYSWVIPSVYSFPVILRTPNPQISYFLIVVSIFMYVNYRRWFLLLLPLPFLYFPVFIFYTYFICSWLIYQILSKKTFGKKNVWANLSSALVIVSLLWICSRLTFIKKWIIYAKLTHNQAYQISESHHFQFPLIFIIFFGFLFILKSQKLVTQNTWFFFLTFLCGLLICSNTQIITGVLFAPKVFQSDAAVIVAGILLVILLNQFVHQFPVRLLNFFLVIITLVVVLKSQGFSFGNATYSIKKYPIFSQQKLELLKKSPFVLINGIDSDFYAQFLPYAIPNLYSPLQAFHYTFFSFITGCENNANYFDKALRVVEKLPDPIFNHDLEISLQRNANEGLLVTHNLKLKFSNLDYCKNFQTKPVPFSIISTNEKIQTIKLNQSHLPGGRGD